MVSFGFTPRLLGVGVGEEFAFAVVTVAGTGRVVDQAGLVPASVNDAEPRLDGTLVLLNDSPVYGTSAGSATFDDAPGASIPIYSRPDWMSARGIRSGLMLHFGNPHGHRAQVVTAFVDPRLYLVPSWTGGISLGTKLTRQVTFGPSALAPTGTVTVRSASRILATVRLGNAEPWREVVVTLTFEAWHLARLSPTKYRSEAIWVEYSGDRYYLPAKTAPQREYQMPAFRPNFTVSTPKTVKRGKRATVSVRLKKNRIHATGSVVVYVNGKKAKTAKLKNGRAKVKVKLAKRGSASIRVKYLGDRFYRPATSKTVKTQVR